MTSWQESTLRAARQACAPRRTGRVSRLVGLRLEVEGIEAAVGDAVRVWRDGGVLDAEVVAVQGDSLACMPFGDLKGVHFGAPVEATLKPMGVEVGTGLLGRILDGLGRPIDDGPPLVDTHTVTVEGSAPHPLRREMIDSQLALGVRAIDTMTPCGRGQRMGIFAGSGVGKSSLLSMIARGTDAPVVVLALVGERGREVNEFIHHDLGPEGLARSVVVVATSDEPALVRIRAAFTATRIAEWFRDQGTDVVLMMDSLTRFAMAQREVGLSAGEPPVTRGYPPSVFSLLPKLLERAGTVGPGEHHRPLHRAGRGRRHERADRRRGPLGPRRPHRPVTPAGHRRALPEYRSARFGVPRRTRHHDPGAPGHGPRTAQAPGRRPRRQGPH